MLSSPSDKSSDITYTAEDDYAIDEWIRKNVASTAHASGTCPMKSRVEGGVVNHRLDVYGVKGLKVAGTYLAYTKSQADYRSIGLTQIAQSDLRF
jgi:choline dehydrogenase-like flavoprotein